jgi:hypothetical protein
MHSAGLAAALTPDNMGPAGSMTQSDSVTIDDAFDSFLKSAFPEDKLGQACDDGIVAGLSAAASGSASGQPISSSPPYAQQTAPPSMIPPGAHVSLPGTLGHGVPVPSAAFQDINTISSSTGAYPIYGSGGWLAAASTPMQPQPAPRPLGSAAVNIPQMLSATSQGLLQRNAYLPGSHAPMPRPPAVPFPLPSLHLSIAPRPFFQPDDPARTSKPPDPGMPMGGLPVSRSHSTNVVAPSASIPQPVHSSSPSHSDAEDTHTQRRPMTVQVSAEGCTP